MDQQRLETLLNNSTKITSGSFTLEETGTDATLRKIHLIDIPNDAIIVKMDDVKFLKFLKPNKELGYNKHSDYMLIVSNKVVFFELKSKTEVNDSLNEECITKFSSDLCVTKYSDSIFEVLLKEGTFFNGKEIHYVLLYQLPSASKNPTLYTQYPPNSTPAEYRRLSVSNDSVISFLRAI